MALRWTAAGMLEAEQQFRRIIGDKDLAKLAVAIDHGHADRPHPDPRGGRYARVQSGLRLPGIRSPGPPADWTATGDDRWLK